MFSSDNNLQMGKGTTDVFEIQLHWANSYEQRIRQYNMKVITWVSLLSLHIIFNIPLWITCIK